MISVYVDMSDFDELLDKIATLDTMPLLIDCANASLSSIRTRVFENGIDSNGQQIGTYSEGYMKVRTGNFENAYRQQRGKNKGQFKQRKDKEGDAGYYTKGMKATFDIKSRQPSSARPRYNRTSDTKVVASLTREMENDMKVIIGKNDTFIGFSNEHNYNKSQWVEDAYKKDIWDLTVEEDAMVDELVNDFVDNMLQ